MRLFLFLITLTLMTLASAEVYRSLDENGNVIFTDKPSPDAEVVKIDKVQTIPAGDDNFKYTPPEKSAESAYTKVEIVDPEDNQVFTGNTGDVTVSVLIEPALNTEIGDRLILSMDGKKQAGSTSTSSSFTNLDRGTHTITAVVVNKDRKSLKSSAPTTFIIKRTIARPRPSTR